MPEVVIVKTDNVYEKGLITVIVDGERKYGHELIWGRIRKEIFMFTKFCNKFLDMGYILATPHGKRHDPVRISPLYSEWNKKVRMVSSPRNVMAIAYNNHETMGYILANQSATDVHIDVICAKPGYGKILMTEFIKEFGHQNIMLNAVSSVLSYYQRYGFHFGDKCGEHHPNLDAMAKTVKSRGDFDMHTLENVYRTRPEVKKLLDTLKSKKLNASDCTSTEKTSNGKTCFALDGFRMVRCKTRRTHKN